MVPLSRRRRRAAGSVIAVLAVPVLAASASTPAFSLPPLQPSFRAHHPHTAQMRCGSRTFALRRLCAASHEPFSNPGSVKNSADAPPAPRPAWQRSWRGKPVAGSRAEAPVAAKQPGAGSQKPSPEAATVEPLAVERRGSVHDLRDAASERKKSRQEELSASFIDRRECAEAPPPPRHSLNCRHAPNVASRGPSSSTSSATSISPGSSPRRSPSVEASADAGDGAAVLQVAVPRENLLITRPA